MYQGNSATFDLNKDISKNARLLQSQKNVVKLFKKFPIRQFSQYQVSVDWLEERFIDSKNSKPLKINDLKLWEFVERSRQLLDEFKKTRSSESGFLYFQVTCFGLFLVPIIGIMVMKNERHDSIPFLVIAFAMMFTLIGSFCCKTKNKEVKQILVLLNELDPFTPFLALQEINFHSDSEVIADNKTKRYLQAEILQQLRVLGIDEKKVQAAGTICLEENDSLSGATKHKKKKSTETNQKFINLVRSYLQEFHDNKSGSVNLVSTGSAITLSLFGMYAIQFTNNSPILSENFHVPLLGVDPTGAQLIFYSGMLGAFITALACIMPKQRSSSAAVALQRLEIALAQLEQLDGVAQTPSLQQASLSNRPKASDSKEDKDKDKEIKDKIALGNMMRKQKPKKNCPQLASLLPYVYSLTSLPKNAVMCLFSLSGTMWQGYKQFKSAAKLVKKPNSAPTSTPTQLKDKPKRTAKKPNLVKIKKKNQSREETKNKPMPTPQSMSDPQSINPINTSILTTVPLDASFLDENKLKESQSLISASDPVPQTPATNKSAQNEENNIVIISLVDDSSLTQVEQTPLSVVTNGEILLEENQLSDVLSNGESKRSSPGLSITSTLSEEVINNFTSEDVDEEEKSFSDTDEEKYPTQQTTPPVTQLWQMTVALQQANQRAEAAEYKSDFYEKMLNQIFRFINAFFGVNLECLPAFNLGQGRSRWLPELFGFNIFVRPATTVQEEHKQANPLPLEANPSLQYQG